MPKPLDLDLRSRIIAAVELGEQNMKEIAARFSVSYHVVKKLKYQWRDTGSFEPKKPRCGRTRSFSPDQQKQLRELVSSNPSLTLLQMRDRIGVDCCEATVWQELRRQGITHKKTVLGKRAETV